MTLDEYLNEHHKNVDGWCSVEKAKRLISLITGLVPELCVEIGVFGGSSLLPQALALQQNKKGLIVGIDPWTSEAALEEMSNQTNQEWWEKIDYEQIYNKLVGYIKNLHLEDYVDLVRDKSENVYESFKDESIDILHIDGNHCESMAFKDVINFFPKVKTNGFIFYDDINWVEEPEKISTKMGLDYLLPRCIQVDVIGDCMILKKLPNRGCNVS